MPVQEERGSQCCDDGNVRPSRHTSFGLEPKIEARFLPLQHSAKAEGKALCPNIRASMHLEEKVCRQM